METPKWKPTREKREVMESIWIQVKGAYHKLKGEINTTNKHIQKILIEMVISYWSKEE